MSGKYQRKDHNNTKSETKKNKKKKHTEGEKRRFLRDPSARRHQISLKILRKPKKKP